MGRLIRCQNNHLFSSARYGTVCPYCDIETATPEKEDIKKRINEDGSIIPLKQEERVCAWIVCIEGVRAGKSYEVRTGYNAIGRGDDMDIQILGDPAINMKNHAVIVYDKKVKQSFLLPGSSNGITYCNEEAIYVSTSLQAYDEIEIGRSKFIFIPFAGKRFSWEEDKE